MVMLILGAAIEKKSVRDMAAGINKLGGQYSFNRVFLHHLIKFIL